MGQLSLRKNKRLAFFLPLIIEAHGLLPTTPLFWANDDKTIPLYRQTLWLHASTIQWLADTGEAYPPELRDEIQPRLNKMRSSPAGQTEAATPASETNEMAGTIRTTQGEGRHAGKSGIHLTGPASIDAIASATV